MAKSPSPSPNKPSEKPESKSSASSLSPVKASWLSTALKTYQLPLVLFAMSLFFQLVFLPNSYPPSHYDVLGIKRGCPIEEVKDAYEKLSSNWYMEDFNGDTFPYKNLGQFGIITRARISLEPTLKKAKIWSVSTTVVPPPKSVLEDESLKLQIGTPWG